MVTITAETVAAAADRLQGDGTNPTQSAVRTALGGGSFSTIALVGTFIGCIIIISVILSKKSLRFRVLITTCRLR